MLNGLIPLWISPLQCTKVYTGTLNGPTMLNDLVPYWIQPLQRTEVYTGTLYRSPMLDDLRSCIGGHLYNAQRFIQVHYMELPCFMTIDSSLDPIFIMHRSLYRYFKWSFPVKWLWNPPLQFLQENTPNCSFTLTFVMQVKLIWLSLDLDGWPTFYI